MLAFFIVAVGCGIYGRVLATRGEQAKARKFLIAAIVADILLCGMSLLLAGIVLNGGQDSIFGGLVLDLIGAALWAFIAYANTRELRQLKTGT